MLDWRMICAAALFGVATPGVAQVGPQPSNPAAWITHRDYPAAAISNGDEGRVSFKLTISSEGLVTGCEITGGTASDSLKQLTCQLVRERAQFNPARNSKGEPAEGTYEATVAWEIPAAGEVPSKSYALPPIPFRMGANALLPEPGRTEIVMTIRPDGTVIEGLYAAGNVMANSFGSKGVGAGTTLGPCLTWGYIAGGDAAARGRGVL